MKALALAPRRAAHGLIRFYQLTLSSLIGRHCRYLPSCSDYADQAIARHGLWAGGWMGAARVCRCHPYGGSGYDPPPAALPDGASWVRPWRYGRWRFRATPLASTSRSIIEENDRADL
jgi:putative membrane protein insertion efficiency factor